MDPYTPSEVPIRISDPKLGAKSTLQRPRKVKNSENQRKQAILDQKRLKRATLCSRKSAKSQMDPHTPSEVPIRISDPKLGAKSTL